MVMTRRVQPVVFTRRAVLVAGAATVTRSLVGCDSTVGYIAEAIAIAAADLVSVYFTGVPIGTLVAGTIHSIQAANASGSTPSPSSSLPLKYQNSMTQEPFDFSNLSARGEGALMSMSTDGPHSHSALNDTGEDIDFVKLVKDDGTFDEVNSAKNGFLFAQKWLSNHDLHLTGLTTRYAKIYYQTVNGRKGVITNLT